MNLIEDRWINVINKSNKIEEVSIYGFFENIEEYIDISSTWMERFTIYNLLFLIAQSSLRGIVVAEKDYKNIFLNGYKEYVLKYLKNENIIDAFNFYGDKFFYKFDIDNDEGHKHNWKKISIDKYSYKHNHTVWESTPIEEMELTDKKKIYNFLTYMLFDPGKGNNYQGSKGWGDKLEFSCYGEKDIIVYLKGQNCYETIWLNLFSENSILKDSEGNQVNDSIGKPLWEMSFNENKVDYLKNAQNTPLGCRLPLHSFFSFEKDSNDIFYHLVDNQGYNKNRHYLFPFKCVDVYKTKNKKESKNNKKNEELEIFYFECDKNKHFMREFPLIFKSLEGVGNGLSTPVIKNIETAIDICKDYGKNNFNSVKIVCGGQIGLKNMSYFKLHGITEFEAVLSFEKEENDIELFSEYSQYFVEKYSECVKLLNNINYKRIACSYHEYFKEKYSIDSVFNFGNEKNTTYDDKLIKIIVKRFWHKLDNEYNFLVEICQKNDSQFKKYKYEWLKNISKIWDSIVNECIPQNESKRVLKAEILKDMVEQIFFHLKGENCGNKTN